jgi:predicted transcriptional regulator
MSGKSEATGHGVAVEYASKIVAAYLSYNHIPASEIPALIKTVHDTCADLAVAGTSSSEETPDATRLPARKPAVPIKDSVKANYIVCLEDGKKLKMLKRYLRGRYKLSPEEYRARWGLPSDYPLVAPNYSATRSAAAKKSGLGRRKRSK